jgi:hypothetical protein
MQGAKFARWWLCEKFDCVFNINLRVLQSALLKREYGHYCFSQLFLATSISDNLGDDAETGFMLPSSRILDLENPAILSFIRKSLRNDY